MKIVRSTQVSEIIGSVTADMLAVIGPDHPKMTKAERERKAAQRHIVALYEDMLLAAWPTVHGPQFGLAEVIQYEG